MEYSALIRARHSVRSFSPRPVDRALLEQVLEAGRLAPTAKNLQPVRILAAESTATRAKLRSLSPCTFDAPVVLVFCGDRCEAYLRDDGRCFAETDTAIVATHVMLAAADAGLGTTWVGLFSADEVARALSLPDNLVPLALMPIGYPAEGETPSPRHSQRKPLTELLSYL